MHLRLASASLVVAAVLVAGCAMDQQRPLYAMAHPEEVPASKTPPPKTSVTFVRRPLPIGAVIEYASQDEVRGRTTHSVNGQETSNDIVVHHSTRTELEVLAIGPHGPTKLRVRYVDKRSDGTYGKQSRKKVDRLRGKTFLVEAREGRIRVTDGDGAPVPVTEVKTVAATFAHLGTPNELTEAVPDGEVHVDQDIPTLAAALRAEMSSTSDDEMVVVRDVRVSFEGTRDDPGGKLGVFSVKLTAESRSERFRTLRTLEGKLFARIEGGRFVELQLAGPVEAQANLSDRQNEISGAGRLELTSQTTATYR